MTPPGNRTGGTPLSLAALLALPELRILARSPVAVDWLGPLCLVPPLGGDPATAGDGGAPAVRVTPEALRMAVVQDCMCRLVLPPGASAPSAAAAPSPPTPPLPSKPPPRTAAAGSADAACATPNDVASTSVESAAFSSADSGEWTVDGGDTAATVSGDDWGAGASIGVDWEASSLPAVGWDVEGSPADSTSGSDLLCDPAEAALPARGDAAVPPPSEWAAGAPTAAGLPEIPPSPPPPSPPPPIPPSLPGVGYDDGSGLGPVVAASSTLHVPIFAKDGMVCGVTFQDAVVDHLEALPGEYFHTPTSRFVLDTASGFMCNASTNGTRAIVSFFGRGRGVASRSDSDEDTSLDCCALSWVRPRTPGGEVHVISRMSMIMSSPLPDHTPGAFSRAFCPQPSSTPTADPDVEDLRRRFVSALTSHEGTFGGGMASAPGVHADGLGPDTEILQVVTSTIPSSWVVAHRLRAAALSACGGVHPARLVLPNACGGGDGLGIPPRGEDDRRQRRRLLPLPLAPRPGALPLPPPPTLPSGGGCGAGRGGGKRARVPIDIDSVTDEVVRARVLRNRESARVSNARRKARAAAARAARKNGVAQGEGTGAVPVAGEGVGPAGGTPPSVLLAAPLPAVLLGGSDAR